MIVRELGRGKYSDCFKVTEAGAEAGAGARAVAVKVSYYDGTTLAAFARHARHGDLGAATSALDRDSISVAMAMAQVAGEMKRRGVSPHVVRVYCGADADRLSSRMGPLLSARLPRLGPEQARRCHVCVMELFGCTMTAVASDGRVANDDMVRDLIFQVVYTLACLQRLVPGFRHNDLSSNNVLVRRRKSGPGSCHASYDFEGTVYVTHTPYFAALSDFDFTHARGQPELSNERVLRGTYGIGAEDNASYDTHLYLRSLRSGLMKSPRRFRETLRFLHALPFTPGRLRPERESPDLVPRRLLRHPYFAPLRHRAGDPTTCTRHYVMPC